MADTTKDTVYIDVDEEITGVIDKVRASKHKIVALVLPKRAAVFQSIVNLKLLKRTAKEHDKRVVLITSEAVLLPLAGAVGLHVAKTLQSKPVIPPSPKVDTEDEAVEDQADVPDEDDEVDTSKTVGELAGPAAAASAIPVEETIELDDEPAETTAAGKPGKKKKKKDKKLAIPNFDSFRKKLLLGGAAFFLLIILWIFGNVILPSAKITIKTDTQTVNANVPMTLNTSAKDLDEDKGIVPASLKSVSKTDTEKVSATGKKDVGEKATGTLTVYNCSNNDVTLPAGTNFNTGSLSFVTNEAVAVPASDFNKGTCKKSPSADVGVTAANAGPQYNIGSGQSFANSSTITATGSAMTGGTSKLLTVVSQSDVDGAKQKMNDRSKNAASDDMKKAFQKDNLYPVVETINGAAPAITTSVKVGDEAGDVTVTQVVNFTMLGAKEDNLKKLIEKEAKKQLDTSKQAISDTGLPKAVIRITDRKSDGEQKITVETIASAGAQIDTTALKKEVAGKKKGDIQKLLQDRPGVKDVDVNYSPFWVYKTPKRTSRINIVLEKPNNASK